MPAVASPSTFGGGSHGFEDGLPRRIQPHWNSSLVVASIAVSFLGAFTSTQLMVQAKTSRYLSAVIVWSILASLTFGFCSIWCLHFIAMLACELDLPIRLNATLTVMSAALAVGFTWVALASDILWDRYRKARRRQAAALRRDPKRNANVRPSMSTATSTNSIRPGQFSDRAKPAKTSHSGPYSSSAPSIPQFDSREPRPMPFTDQPDVQFHLTHDPLLATSFDTAAVPLLQRSPSLDNTDEATNSEVDWTETTSRSSYSGYRSSRRSSGFTSSDPSIGLGRFASVRNVKQSAFGDKNPFVAIGLALYAGLTLRNILKGFVWSLAITGMHYSGIKALQIPNGWCSLDPIFVILSAIISWTVCVVGCVLLSSMETRLGQQLLFSMIATAGVAAMHFTGMRAADFWSIEAPSEERGYPPGLVIAIVSIAITTCLAANGLLAHSATIARNKLVEIVHTRKNLWAAIAQKENAEAAALARSEFIASASHEIRSPIHQLQGYSDLLARSNLDGESRLLLHAMQDAIRSLSLITTTVLDWSRLEKGEAICRPTAVNVRRVCESVLNILPSKDEDCDVELLIAVAPDVPDSLFIDETYLHRIIMNLLSNSLKFTSSGYVMLQVKLEDQSMVVTVADTGNGIPESFLPDLFEPFKQAQSRGPQRGTGLGLSIVKQLLQKMSGTIGTESKDKNFFPDDSGTTFTATFPVQPAGEARAVAPDLSGRIAIYGNLGSRSLDGVRLCWEMHGLEAVRLSAATPLPPDIHLVWASMEYLRSNPSLLRWLRDDQEKLVLIPFDEDKPLLELLGSSPPRHILPLRRPLTFHKIAQAAADPSRKASRPDTLSRTVRFASVVDLVDDPDDGEGPGPMERSTTESTASSSGPATPPAKVVMLVEDNKINQRLGVKMLKTLGYDVIIADDGQDAIDSLLEHAPGVDAILMDQSMPRKDGLTATREIREMEANGTLPLRAGRPIPIIAVTAVVGAHAEAMCRQAGTDDFLPKPLSLSKLRKTLETFLIDFSAD